MTSAIIMLALLTAMEGRQFRTGTAALIAGDRVDLLGDGSEPDQALTDEDELAVELHVAMFGDWTMDTRA
jgi:hypothetical protein